jgi:hypothetical protein
MNTMQLMCIDVQYSEVKDSSVDILGTVEIQYIEVQYIEVQYIEVQYIEV